MGEKTAEQMRSTEEISRALEALRRDLAPIDFHRDVVIGIVPGIGDPGRQRRLGRIEALEWVMKQRGRGPTAIDSDIRESRRTASVAEGSRPFSLSVVAQEEQAWMGGKLSFPPVEQEGSR